MCVKYTAKTSDTMAEFSKTTMDAYDRANAEEDGDRYRDDDVNSVPASPSPSDASLMDSDTDDEQGGGGKRRKLNSKMPPWEASTTLCPNKTRPMTTQSDLGVPISKPFVAFQDEVKPLSASPSLGTPISKPFVVFQDEIKPVPNLAPEKTRNLFFARPIGGAAIEPTEDWSQNGKRLEKYLLDVVGMSSCDGALDDGLVRRFEASFTQSTIDVIAKFIAKWKHASGLAGEEQRIIGTVYRGNSWQVASKESVASTLSQPHVVQDSTREFVVHETDMFGVLSYALFGTRCVSKCLKLIACVSYLSKHKPNMNVTVFKEQFMKTRGSTEEVSAFSHLCGMLRVLAVLRVYESHQKSTYHVLVDEQCAQRTPHHLALLFSNRANDTYGVLLPKAHEGPFSISERC